MVLQVGAVRRLLAGDQARERNALTFVEGTGREALGEMRRLLGILRRGEDHGEFTPQPSLRRLDELAESVRHAGLPVELEVDGEPLELPGSLDVSAFRIVQEALTNALRHAGPARAWVSVRYGRGAVELEVLDDGRGADNGNGTAGHGLIGMRERVVLFGGDLEAGPRPEGGFRVRAVLPVEPAA
jgi:signal transduction histidine kinase